MQQSIRSSATSPQVILDVEFRAGAFILVLANVGDGMAFDPRVKFKDRVIGAGGEVVVSDLPVWSKLSMLRPGKDVEVFLDAGSSVFRRGSLSFSATVAYTDRDGRHYEHIYHHDLDAYRDLPQIQG